MNLNIGLKDIIRIAVLVILLFALLFTLTWSNYVKCNAIPGWCSVYYSVMGKPKILIAYADDGLGNPQQLKKILTDPEKIPDEIRSTPSLIHIDFISSKNLENYDIVIVEKAKTMSTAKLKMFQDYVVKSNGKLIWVADAGTLGYKEDELLLESERTGNDKNIVIGPWSRKTELGETVNFDLILSANYLGNYCDFKKCNKTFPYVGQLIPNKESTLVIGLKKNFPMYGNYSIIKEVPTGGALRALSVKGTPINDFGTVQAIAIQSMNERVIYYAVPPETFIAKEIGEENFAPSLIENLILTITGKIS